MVEKLLFKWRRALLHEKSGLSSTQRFILIVLATYMQDDGSRCFPSIRKLELDTQLSGRALCTNLQQAETKGWIRVEKVNTGKKWLGNRYIPLIPVERGSLGAVEPNTRPVELNDTNLLNEVQSNSSYNSSKNSNGVYIKPESQNRRSKAHLEAMQNIKTLIPKIKVEL